MTTRSTPVRRALVLGASGHLGNAIGRELLRRGARVTAVRRGKSDARNLAGLDVASVFGDADAGIDAWLEDHDLVVDAAAPYPLGADERDAVEIAALRAEAIVRAARRRGARVVHVSAFITRITRDAAGHPHGWRQRAEAMHPYFESKRVGEEVFADAARAGDPVSIVNPTFCLGPWDGKPRDLALVPRLVRSEVPAVPAHIVNVVDVRDVAVAAVEVAERAQPGPMLVSGHNIGLPELCSLVCELAGAPRRTVGVPPGLGAAASWLTEVSRNVSGWPAVSPLLPALLVGRHVPLTVQHAQRAIGASPRPLTATLRDAIAWHRHVGDC